MVFLFTDSFFAAFFAVLLTMSYLVIIARMIAECGMPTFQTATELGDAFIALGMPTILGPQAFVIMNYLGGTLLSDDRSNMSGFNAQSAAIAERAQICRWQVAVCRCRGGVAGAGFGHVVADRQSNGPAQHLWSFMAVIANGTWLTQSIPSMRTLMVSLV